MADANKEKLGNAKKKSPYGFPKKDPLGVAAFKYEWQRALKRKGLVWEGARAVAELDHKGTLPFLLFTGYWKDTWKGRQLIHGMVSEMKEYRREVSRLDREVFQDGRDFLKTIAKRVHRYRMKVPIVAIQLELQKIERIIQKSINALKTADERRRSFSPLGYIEDFFWDLRRIHSPRRKTELDTRLQIQLAKLLTTYLRRDGKVSLATIARLISLAYCVGRLARIDGGQMWLNRSEGNRVLRVSQVAENLRDAGFHKTKSFKGKL